MDSMPQPQEQAQSMQGLLDQIQQIQGAQTSPDSSAAPASGSTSKNLINIVFVVIFAVGIGGCFLTENTTLKFDMDAYVKFIQVFAYIWIPIVLAVGGGRAFKHYASKKFSATPPAADPGAGK